MTREHRGKCPRCESTDRKHIRSWCERATSGTDLYDWDTCWCRACGLRYDE